MPKSTKSSSSSSKNNQDVIDNSKMNITLASENVDNKVKTTATTTAKKNMKSIIKKSPKITDTATEPSFNGGGSIAATTTTKQDDEPDVKKSLTIQEQLRRTYWNIEDENENENEREDENRNGTHGVSTKPPLIKQPKPKFIGSRLEDSKYTIDPFKILDSIFKQNDNREMIAHQYGSYDQFIKKDLGDIIKQFNTRKLFFNYDKEINKHLIELHIDFLNYNIGKPTNNENDGSCHIITPEIARCRNLTYSAPLSINIKLTRIMRKNIRRQKAQENGEIDEAYPAGNTLSQYEADESFIPEDAPDIDPEVLKLGYTEDKKEQIFSNINFGRIPIMVMSHNCVLNKKDGTKIEQNGECKYDFGGYFIIGGNEKVIISQERIAENEPLVFYNAKKTKGQEIEIRCVSDQQFSVVITNLLRYVYKDNTIEFESPNFKNPVPLFLLLRCLGVKTDKNLIEHVAWNLTDDIGVELVNKLKSSFDKYQKIVNDHANKKSSDNSSAASAASAASATPSNNPLDDDFYLEILLGYLKYKGLNKEIKFTMRDRIDYLKKTLEDDVLPHIGGSFVKKAKYIGFMVRKLLHVILGYSPYDDRDAYENKRVEAPGRLMASLFRQCFNKLVKDMVKSIAKEVNGNKSGKDLLEIITTNNIYKIVKPTIIDGGLKYALATGNWGVKSGGKGNMKVGTAQVLNRLSYLSYISHLRRLSSPNDKTSSNGKIVKPRKLHETQWGYICPAETPEGQPVGLVKNLALTSKITTNCNSSMIRLFIQQNGLIDIEEIEAGKIADNATVFVNGDFIGVHSNPVELVTTLKTARRSGNINIYTGVHWNKELNVIRVYTDAGRIMRPLLIVDEDNKLRCTDEHIKELVKYNYDYRYLVCPKLFTDRKVNCLTNKNNIEGVIEYIDTIETTNLLISMFPRDLQNQDAPYVNTYSHCEIHPGVILGVIASVIPFSDHNQSPRNAYQSSMCKQNMGFYATNFQKRMDTLGYVVNNLERPLVSTRFSKYINYYNMPCGMNAIVAIASYTGYNQEDSILLNQAAVDRGLFHGTYYRTYKDDEKKIQSSGREEKFAIPNSKYFKGRKPGNYDKLDERGFIRKNEYVCSDDIIIGKVLPLKNKTVNGNQIFKDCSTSLKSNESGFIDEVYTNRNADGFRFVKIRTRTKRIPVIGDKFASRSGQKGTVGMIYPQEQMPFNSEGISPDIIMNPHAIPSRMTIGQLLECILGKASAILGGYSDSTPFNEVNPDKITDILEMNGFDYAGNEILYSGITGQQLDVKIFFGPTYYQRLKHMVADKMHSRATGAVTQATRQPQEGRSRDGGLRFGEMERDCSKYGTLISLSNGLSLPIEQFENFRNASVLGWAKDTNCMMPSEFKAFAYKGERECVEITLEDGRKLGFTPEHPFLTSDNTWVKANELIRGETRIKCSVNYPKSDISDIESCKNWSLKLNDDFVLKADNFDEYSKSLAFCRILGYLITDGYISFEKRDNRNVANIYLGHLIDVNRMLDDVKLFIQSNQKKFNAGNLYVVRLPSKFVKHIITVKGILRGRRITQNATGIPEFILDPNCPLPLVREFLAGIFGGDGHTCNIAKNTFTYISYSQSKHESCLDSLKLMMEQIKGLLARFDIVGVTVQAPKLNSSCKKKNSPDGEKKYEVVLHLDQTELIPFHDKIGFRYCCHKTQRLEAAVTYTRMRTEIGRQKRWIIGRVGELTNYAARKKEIAENTESKTKNIRTKDELEQAIKELAEKEPILHPASIPTRHDINEVFTNGRSAGEKFAAKSFPSSTEFLKSIDAYEWFSPKNDPVKIDINNDDLDNPEDDYDETTDETTIASEVETETTTETANDACNSTQYGVCRDNCGIPTMNLKVIDVRPAGVHKVYDIEVDKTHSFLADGAVAHNCMISHGALGFLKERLLDVSDAFNIYCCKNCGLFSVANTEPDYELGEEEIFMCTGCKDYSEFALLRMPYACKLLFQELQGMMMVPRIKCDVDEHIPSGVDAIHSHKK